MKIGGLKAGTVIIVRYYTGTTTSALPGATSKNWDGSSKRKHESYRARAIDLPLYPAFQEDLATCTKW